MQFFGLKKNHGFLTEIALFSTFQVIMERQKFPLTVVENEKIQEEMLPGGGDEQSPSNDNEDGKKHGHGVKNFEQDESNHPEPSIGKKQCLKKIRPVRFKY